jgi:hypothetical protein
MTRFAQEWARRTNPEMNPTDLEEKIETGERGLTKKVQRPNLRRDAERRREITTEKHETSPCRLGPLEPTVRPSLKQ